MPRVMRPNFLNIDREIQQALNAAGASECGREARHATCAKPRPALTSSDVNVVYLTCLRSSNRTTKTC